MQLAYSIIANASKFQRPCYRTQNMTNSSQIALWP